LLAVLACSACTENAQHAERPRAPSPAPVSIAQAPELSSLARVARSGRPSEPVRILAPVAGAELDPATASSLVVEVAGPRDAVASLVLSLDGARPRPVAPGTLAAARLLGPGAALAVGTHDLVLAAVSAQGVALEPSEGGVAAVRFFVGPRPRVLEPRVVCLSPFGTVYGKAPAVVLDFVVVGGEPADAIVVLRSEGTSRQVRASGTGPFALGDPSPGDHELSITLAGVTAVPGRCGFAYNPELERPR
jgi:hypothetical protein